MSELVQVLRSLQAGLDELETRVRELEASPMRFSAAEAARTRREVVKRMRADGLSVERIARATGAGRTTVLRDLDAVDIATPDRVVGTDGRAYPSTHTWGRRGDGEVSASA